MRGQEFAGLQDIAQALNVDDSLELFKMEKNCADKQKHFDANVQMRGQELAGHQDIAQVLNDDDSLELFGKASGGASSLFQ